LEDLFVPYAEKRCERREKFAKVRNEGWEAIPPSEQYHFRGPKARSRYASFKFDDQSPLALFRTFFPLALAQQVLDAVPTEKWILQRRSGTNTVQRVRPSLKVAYQTLAVYIWAMGRQHHANPNRKEKYGIKDTMKDAEAYFKQRLGDDDKAFEFPSHTYMEK